MRFWIFILVTWFGWGGTAWAHVRPTAGGDTSGQSLRLSRYTNNLLNQITGRDFPGTNDLLGTVPSLATVSVNGQTNVYRHGEYFQKTITVNNTTGAVWLALTNQGLSNGVVIQTVTGSLFFPRTAETFQYDADGNLTNDGHWSYTWDAENQLTSMESRAGILPAQKLLFTYDWLGRRTSKVVSNCVSGNWQLATDNRFVYDGWNLIAILDSQTNVLQSFTWGLDASGTMQGAGGVGGLLSMTIPSGANSGTYFYCYDGNHNVVGLVSATNGAVVAQYEYGPFHELLRATGPLAQTNHFLAATKYLDWETGLYYYGFRYYDPSTGRWLSRDPIGEAGGVNLSGFVGNDPANAADTDGRLPLWFQRVKVTLLKWAAAKAEEAGRDDLAIGLTYAYEMEAATPVPFDLTGGVESKLNRLKTAKFMYDRLRSERDGRLWSAGQVALRDQLSRLGLTAPVEFVRKKDLVTGQDLDRLTRTGRGLETAGNLILLVLPLKCNKVPPPMAEPPMLVVEVKAPPTSIRVVPAAAEGETSAWRIGPHGEMPNPRPAGFESHHGVNSVWMEENVVGYTAGDAPAVLMKNDPFHNATRGVFNRVRSQIAARQAVSPRNIDWSKVSPGTAWRLAEEQFEAAQVPASVRAEYFRQLNDYLELLPK
jgi:RHS repeat-associated protein